MNVPLVLAVMAATTIVVVISQTYRELRERRVWL